jgi:hypothetical protein
VFRKADCRDPHGIARARLKLTRSSSRRYRPRAMRCSRSGALLDAQTRRTPPGATRRQEAQRSAQCNARPMVSTRMFRRRLGAFRLYLYQGQAAGSARVASRAAASIAGSASTPTMRPTIRGEAKGQEAGPRSEIDQTIRIPQPNRRATVSKKPTAYGGRKCWYRGTVVANRAMIFAAPSRIRSGAGAHASSHRLRPLWPPRACQISQ